MQKYIDTHAHYLSYRFNNDREELLKNLLEGKLEYIVECGTNTNVNKSVVDFCHKHDRVYGTIGYFPCDVSELEHNPMRLQLLAKQLEDEKIIGMGEIGLDNHHPGDKEMQASWFCMQLSLARDMNVPICIHSREAEKETMNILEKFGKTHGVFHCYSYGSETMKKLVSLGFYFGVGGTSTYMSNIELRKAIEDMPIDRIVLETDAPYLSPAPVKRQRNDSGYIEYVIDNISKLKGVSCEKVVEITNQNAFELYPKLGK